MIFASRRGGGPDEQGGSGGGERRDGGRPSGAPFGTSPKTLTDRLRALEEQGLVERVMFAEIPQRVEYTLTERGRRLEPVLNALRDWGTTI